MTLEELERNWKDYAITDGRKTVALKDIAVICYGTFKGGLLFDSGGEQGNPHFLLKPDEEGNCYQKTDWDAPDDEGWKKIGRFVKRKDL